MIKSVLLFFLYWAALFIVSIIASGFLSEDSIAFGMASLFALIGAPISALYLVKWRKNRFAKALVEKKDSFNRRRFVEREQLLESTRLHKAALKRNLSRAYKKNDYGALIQDRTYDAIDEFLTSISHDFEAIPMQEARELIFEELDFQKATEVSQGFNPDDLPFDGYAFEAWVSRALEKFDWETEVTKGGADQGVDVIARKGAIKVAIQCKLYSSAVGNAAVQQAHAGAAYYQATHAAVLTNANFTKGAQDLAQMTGVLLLSQHDIPQLTEILQEKRNSF